MSATIASLRSELDHQRIWWSIRSQRVRVKKCANTDPRPFDRRAGALVLVVLALRFVRPVDDERLALDVVARQEAPVAAVLRVVAVVAHHEVLIGRHRDRAVALAHVERRDLARAPSGRRAARGSARTARRAAVPLM